MLVGSGSRLRSAIPFVRAPGLDMRLGPCLRSAGGAGNPQPGGSYFIATLPRSGSWLLAEMLAGTGLAGVPNEYFRPDFTALWAAEWGLAENTPYSAYVQAAKRSTMTPNGIFSAKLHWYQFSWLCQQLPGQCGTARGASSAQRLLDWFPGLKYVFLRRCDTARQAVSYYRASVTQQWFLTHDRRKQPLDPAAADFQQIKWFEDNLLGHYAQWRSFFAASAVTPLEVTYEDLATDSESAVHRILSFLKISGHTVTAGMAPTLRRQSDRQSEAILDKYLAIRGSLLPTPRGLFWSETERRFRTVTASEPDESHPGR